MKNFKYFKVGLLYPIKKYPLPRQHSGKCNYCSCPVLFTPQLEVIEENFKVTGWKVTNSKNEAHHCLKYKLG